MIPVQAESDSFQQVFSLFSFFDEQGASPSILRDVLRSVLVPSSGPPALLSCYEEERKYMRLFHLQITGLVTAVSASDKRAKLGVFPGRENILNSRKACLRDVLIMIYLVKIH